MRKRFYPAVKDIIPDLHPTLPRGEWPLANSLDQEKERYEEEPSGADRDTMEAWSGLWSIIGKFCIETSCRPKTKPPRTERRFSNTITKHETFIGLRTRVMLMHYKRKASMTIGIWIWRKVIVRSLGWTAKIHNIKQMSTKRRDMGRTSINRATSDNETWKHLVTTFGRYNPEARSEKQ